MLPDYSWVSDTHDQSLSTTMNGHGNAPMPSMTIPVPVHESSCNRTLMMFENQQQISIFGNDNTSIGYVYTHINVLLTHSQALQHSILNTSKDNDYLATSAAEPFEDESTSSLITT